MAFLFKPTQVMSRRMVCLSLFGALAILVIPQEIVAGQNLEGPGSLSESLSNKDVGSQYRGITRRDAWKAIESNGKPWDWDGDGNPWDWDGKPWEWCAISMGLRSLVLDGPVLLLPRI